MCAIVSKLALSHFEMGTTYSFYREEKKDSGGLQEKTMLCAYHIV